VLEIKLLEEIAGSNGDLAEWLLGVSVGPFLKDFARFREFLYVEVVKTIFEFGDGRNAGVSETCVGAACGNAGGETGVKVSPAAVRNA